MRDRTGQGNGRLLVPLEVDPCRRTRRSPMHRIGESPTRNRDIPQGSYHAPSIRRVYFLFPDQ